MEIVNPMLSSNQTKPRPNPWRSLQWIPRLALLSALFASPIWADADIEGTSETNSVDRPWMINTPAGPTAFVLEENQFLFGFESSHTSRILGSTTAFEAKYGLSEAFTLGVGATAKTRNGSQTFYLHPKWNIYNEDGASYAISPWIGFRSESDRNYYSSGFLEGSNPLGIELAYSRTYDDRHKLHINFTLGTYKETWWDYRHYNNHPSDNTHTSRLSIAYELRVSRKHGFTFSFSPETKFESWWVRRDYSYQDRVEFNEREIDLNLGVGYHYFWKGFGVSIGLESGPRHRSAKSLNWEYSSLSNFRIPNGSLTLDFRI